MVDVEGGSQLRFRAATGIPLDPSRRGGLSEEVWDARRRGLLKALFEASVRAQAGEPEAGAVILERFSAEGGGSPELLSIPLYRAALLRMQQAPGAGPASLVQALEDVSRACELESRPNTPPRYLLLHADLLTRLGREQEALRRLSGWWSGSAQETYYYEWMLLGWRAGSDPPLAQLIAGFPGGSPQEWPSLIRLAHASRHGAFAAGRAEAEQLNARRIQWDIHHYWAARLYLEGPQPDPSAALAHLDRAKESFKTGVHVPFEAARLHALLLRNPADRPTSLKLEDARRDLEETAECAATNVECLTLLEYGERDMAAVRSALEPEPR